LDLTPFAIIGRSVDLLLRVHFWFFNSLFVGVQVMLLRHSFIFPDGAFLYLLAIDMVLTLSCFPG